MNRKWIKRIVLSLIVILIMGEGLSIYKLYRHVIYYDGKIQQLESDINLLGFSSSVNTVKSEVEWSGEAFNYLALGNSITKHPICDYWFNEIGMAASSEDTDYFHIVSESLRNILEDKYSDGLRAYAYNFSVWEHQVNDRAETLSVLEGILDERINLITIQLGENVYNFETFEEDYKELLTYFRRECPNAQIIAVGNFWNSPTCENIKASVTKSLSIDYVDLTDIWGDDEYVAGMGTVVYGQEGEMHLIEHEGVANHPSDRGMQYIADSIIDMINKR